MKVRGTSWAAFTLIELLLASVAAAMVLVIINGLFVRAIHLRDDATERVRASRLRVRAEHAIRDDLQSALVSGGILASTLTGGTNSASGPGGANFPGYLKVTTTNGRSASGQAASDVQQVEYYITADPNAGAATANAGVLVRAITRDLLATTPTVAKEETLLSGVQALQVQFYDGTTWLDTWDFDSDTANANSSAGTGSTTLTTGNSTLPEAVRVDVRMIAKAGDLPSPPVEVLVPWDTQPFVGATPSTSTVNGGGGGGNAGNGQNGNQGGNNGPGGGNQPGQPGRPPGEGGSGGPGGPPPSGGEGPGGPPAGGEGPGGPPPGQQPPTGPGNRPPRR